RTSVGCECAGHADMFRSIRYLSLNRLGREGERSDQRSLLCPAPTKAGAVPLAYNVRGRKAKQASEAETSPQRFRRVQPRGLEFPSLSWRCVHALLQRAMTRSRGEALQSGQRLLLALIRPPFLKRGAE